MKITGKIKSAKGITGFLLKDFEGQYFFRVYNKDKTFIDYEILHSDLQVTISNGCDATFYTYDDNSIINNTLDHDPETLGININEDSSIK